MEEIDNILKEGRKKGLNSGRKGKQGERDLCKLLNKRFGGGFSRSVGSGNRSRQVNLPYHAQQTYGGDLVCCTLNFAWIFECKNGYNDLDLNSVFENGNAILDGFLKQVTDDATRTERKPILVWKKNRKPWIAFLFTKDLPHINWQFRLIYKEWSAIPLKELLTIEDSFFFKN